MVEITNKSESYLKEIRLYLNTLIKLKIQNRDRLIEISSRIDKMLEEIKK